MKIRVAIPLQLTEDQRSRLESLGADYFAADRIDPKAGEAELSKRIGDAAVAVIGPQIPVRADFLKEHPGLRFIQSASTGLDHVDMAAAASLGVTVKNSGDYCTEAVAERTLALMLAAATQVINCNRLAMSGVWDGLRYRGRELQGRTLLVVGRGRIGKRVAELASVFGMRVVFATSSTPREEFLRGLSTADFVSLHCPLTPRTDHLMSSEAFRQMKPDAVLVNTARGKLIDEAALLEALNSKKLSVAALDVLAAQPPPKDHPLLNHERAIVTPFCAWNTEEAVPKRNEIIIASIKEFVATRGRSASTRP